MKIRSVRGGKSRSLFFAQRALRMIILSSVFMRTRAEIATFVAVIFSRRIKRRRYYTPGRARGLRESRRRSKTQPFQKQNNNVERESVYPTRFVRRIGYSTSFPLSLVFSLSPRLSLSRREHIPAVSNHETGVTVLGEKSRRFDPLSPFRPVRRRTGGPSPPTYD